MNRLRRFLFITTLTCCIFLITGVAFSVPDRVPFTISDDFETGEMHAWEAYPYAQDIGYEPFTTCFPEPAHNDSKFSLGNIRRAWDIVEVYQGFTKEIDLWTSGDSRFKAAIFLTAERKPAKLELSLGCFDGSRYFCVICSPEVNRWLELDIPVREFSMEGQPLTSGKHIQVITIKAEYPSVYHLSSYTISLDDFSLNGERDRRFVTLDPKSTTFEHYGYSILHRHFYTGDAFEITVHPEDGPGKNPLSSVSLSLVDPNGKKVVSGVKLKASENVWKAERAYKFKKTDTCGQWTVNLSGKDKTGNETRWGFRFIMPGNRLTPADHPRLFWTTKELKKRLATQSAEEKKMMDGFIPGAERLRRVNISEINESTNLSTEALTGHAFSKPRGVNWRGPISSLSGTAESGALRYALDGDVEAGQKAREALLKLCQFKRWNHPWQLAHGNHMYYPVGYTIGPIGIAYDLIYPLLSEADKKIIIDGLMDKGVKMFYRDMVEMNRMPSSVTNHIAVIVSNLAVATTAVYGEDPNNSSLEPYFSGILAKMKRFMDRTYYPDGGYGEPKGYENMATRDIVEALYVLERNFGIDYTTTTNLKELWRYPLHAAYSNGRMPDYGDTGVYGGWGWTGNPFQWLSRRMKNPYTAYFTQAEPEQGRRRRGNLYQWLWYHKGLETKSREEFIPSHHFPVKGHMVMRSCWSDEGTIMVFKSGPNSNHYHIDQGSILLATNGEILLSEASLETFKGYHAYYANPFYPFYTTQAMGHNVMLIDGDPESQVQADYENGIAALRNWPRILHSFAGWNVDEVEGDLTCVYKGKAEQYTRSFLYMKPDIIFMLDRVKSPEEHHYDWLFHAEDHEGEASISRKGNRIRINRPRAMLSIDVLSPEVRGRVRPAERSESFIQLTSPDNLREVEFLAVIVPTAKNSPSDPEKKFSSSLLNVRGWTGAKVDINSSVVKAFFRKDTGGEVAVEGFITDAERFAVETGADGVIRKVFMRGSEFSVEGISLKSGSFVSASLSISAELIELEADSEKGTDISLKLAKAPASITLNDAKVRRPKYNRSSQELTIPLPAGHSLVKVNW